jgi:hypothetical protein
MDSAPRNWGMGIIGIILVLISIPIAIVVWLLLPEGRYPILIVAVPAIPLLAGGGYLIRRSNIGLEEWIDKHPSAFTCLVVLAIILAFVLWGTIIGF